MIRVSAETWADYLSSFRTYATELGPNLMLVRGSNSRMVLGAVKYEPRKSYHIHPTAHLEHPEDLLRPTYADHYVDNPPQELPYGT